ncbi:tetratricopeptide repeat protein [Pyxidicoccus xibeiensis]|uniref:tetratricopeptide repeat protein n=1 Tax=Pyxidicoccus xibeiensis TaxID=2906759 RepID=UPI00225DE893|nr:tetratricopeptide repeat protein [Pyxidicoccus xibeiensis]
MSQSLQEVLSWLHGLRMPAWGPEALVWVLGVGFLLWGAWHLLVAAFPRLGSGLYPHALVGLVLLFLLVTGFTALVLGIDWLWSHHDALWKELTRGSLGAVLGPLDWLWPWFPTLLVLGALLTLAAHHFSRRNFHLLSAGLLLGTFLGVALHGEPAPSGQVAGWGVPERQSAGGALVPPMLRIPQPAMVACIATDASVPFAPYVPAALAASCVPGTATGDVFALNPSPLERSVDAVVLQRGAERFFEPVLHREGAHPDLVTLILLGVGLLLGYGWLDRINLRQALLPIKVQGIEDAGGKRRPDLELLMRECLHRNTPHTPAPLPGGSLIYWQDFVEQQSIKDQHWLTRVAALVMRVVHPPAGMEISGTIIDSAEGQQGPPVKFGIRVHMVDVYSRQTLLARTFWSNTQVEHAVEDAAYFAVERAMEECGKLPEWAYWREEDALVGVNSGTALREYHEGVLRMREDAGKAAVAEQAVSHLKQAAQLSPGTALTWLQLAEALEAANDYVGAIEIYLELITRHRHLLVAKYRLASVCRSVREWGPGLDDWKPSQAGELNPWARLGVALSGVKARRLRRPTLQCRGRRWRAMAGHGWPRALKATLSREPDPLIEGSLGALQDVLLDMALRCTKQLERAARWWLPLWCLKNTSERRLFWKTVLWPPRRLRGLYLSIKAARLNVELQRLQRLRDAYLPRPPPFGWNVRRGGCRFRAWRVDFEARHAMRIRGHWMGNTHFNLACFHALRMRDEDSDRVREARRATFHLTCALGDPEGPFSASTWRWLLRYPELEPLRRSDALKAWGHVSLRVPDVRAELFPGKA